MAARSASQRDRILQAMIDEVAERGYRQTTVAHVCSAAGVSRATFYELFDDKESCFLATFEHLDDLLKALLANALDGVEGAPARVRAGLEAFLGALATQPAATRAAILEVGAAGPRAREAYRHSVFRFAEVVEEARGLVEDDEELPELTSKMVVGGIAAAVFEEVAAGHIEDLPRLLPDLIYLLLVPYLGHEGALAEHDAASDRKEHE